MKFELRTAGAFYSINNDDKVPKLKELGFGFRIHQGRLYMHKSLTEIEINSLEDLLKLSDEFDCKVIIDREEIIIYDDYLE